MKESKIKIYVGNAPVEKENEAKIQYIKQIQKSRRELRQKMKKVNFHYYCSLCLIIRDENEYLKEWLEWHINQGIEHFYIYDHGSKEPVTEFIKNLDNTIQEKITIINWSGEHNDAQPDAYNDCLNHYREESRWIGFIDADEQIEIKTGESLPEFLKKYEKYAGIFAIWVTYGANGQIKKTPGLLRQRFTQISHSDQWAESAGKVIVQPMYMKEMVIHNGKAMLGFHIVNEGRKKLDNYSLRAENPTRDTICINHYYTKSYEEWMNKLRRGSGHAKYLRKYEEFFRVNPDMEYCRENINIHQEYGKFETNEKSKN